MRPIILLAAVVALASGLLGAFAYGELFGRAGAAPPATAVREQNLDASGRIQVHEQGTANVNVTNGSLPVSGTLDVGNLPIDGEGRLIELTPMTPGGGGFYFSPLVSVGDCKLVTVLVRGGLVSQIVNISPDGATRIEARLDGTLQGSSGVNESSILNAPIAAPFLEVRADTAAGAPTPGAWIWCEP